MANETRGGTLRKRIWLGAFVPSLAAPVASASPKEDTGQAEKEFARDNLVK